MTKTTGFLLLYNSLLLFELQPLLAQGGNRAVDPDSPVVSFKPPQEAIARGGRRDAGRLVIIRFPKHLKLLARFPAGGNFYETWQPMGVCVL